MDSCDIIGYLEKTESIKESFYTAVYDGENTRFKYIDGQFSTVTGYSPCFFKENAFSYESLLDCNAIKARKDAILNSIKTDRPFNTVYEIKIPGDSDRVTLVHEKGSVKKDDNGDIYTVCGVITCIPVVIGIDDLIEKYNLYSRFFNLSCELLMVLDTNSRVIEINSSAAEAYGTTREEAIGRKCYDIVGCVCGQTREDCPYLQAIAEKKPCMKEVSDDTLTYNVTVVPYYDKDGNLKGCMHSSQNITLMIYQQQKVEEYAEEFRIANSKLVRVQDELVDINESLEEKVLEKTAEVHSLSNEILKRNLEVEGLLKQKDGFIKKLAHDLRTPLTPLIGLLPILKEDFGDPEHAKTLELFDMGVQALWETVEEIVKYTTIAGSQGIRDYQKFNLKRLLNRLTAGKDEEIREKDIAVINTVPDDFEVVLSDSYGPIIFQNLIDNAVSFNVENGMIEYDAVITSEGWIKITISDSGQGISEDFIDRMWEEFATGDNARRDPFKKGMGLPTAKKAVSLHKGYITGSSPGPGKGAVFTVMLPPQTDAAVKSRK